MSDLVEGAVTGATNEVKLSPFVGAGYLKTARHVTLASRVDRMAASFVQESDESITRRAFQIRAIGVPVPVTRSRCEPEEVLPTLTAYRAARLPRLRRVDRLPGIFVLDSGHLA